MRKCQLFSGVKLNSVFLKTVVYRFSCSDKKKDFTKFYVYEKSVYWIKFLHGSKILCSQCFHFLFFCFQWRRKAAVLETRYHSKHCVNYSSGRYNKSFRIFVGLFLATHSTRWALLFNFPLIVFDKGYFSAIHPTFLLSGKKELLLPFDA